MKIRRSYNGQLELCPKCDYDGWRFSPNRSKYTNPEKTEGITRDVLICDKCGYTEYHNTRKFIVEEVTT